MPMHFWFFSSNSPPVQPSVQHWPIWVHGWGNGPWQRIRARLHTAGMLNLENANSTFSKTYRDFHWFFEIGFLISINSALLKVGSHGKILPNLYPQACSVLARLFRSWTFCIIEFSSSKSFRMSSRQWNGIITCVYITSVWEQKLRRKHIAPWCMCKFWLQKAPA